jgi:hypothetical protein
LIGLKDINVLHKILYKLNKDIEDIDSFFYTYFKLNPRNTNEYIILENQIDNLGARNPKDLKSSEKLLAERGANEWKKRKEILADKETINGVMAALEKEKELGKEESQVPKQKIVLASVKGTDEIVRSLEKG